MGMPRTIGAACACAAALAGCYAGGRAERDVAAAWRGRARAELIARWGRPAEELAGGTQLRWSVTHTNVELPSVSGHASVSIGPGGIDAEGALAATPGRTWDTRTDTIVTLDGGGRVAGITGPALRWGAPGGLNLRWGTVFGFHAGMGRLDDTGTPLPGGGVYLGGMIGPRLALAGSFHLVAGTSDDGGALALAPAMIVQWWPAARINVHGGPAMVIDWDPGFDNGGLRPGVDAGASLALVRSGSFVLDARLDVVGSTAHAAGVVGVGVNVN